MQQHSTSRRGAKASADTTLVLTGTVNLAVRRGRLAVQDGCAALHSNREFELEPPLKLETVMLLTSGGGNYSEHALRLLAESGASVYSLKQNGEVNFYLLPPPGPMKPGLLRLQATLPDAPEGLIMAKSLILRKIEKQQEVLNWLAKRAVLPGLEDAVSASFLPVEAATKASDYNSLRIAEACAADTYFNAWHSMPVAFEKTDARNIQPPNHWRRYTRRGSLKTGDNQEATCPINALLNFSYAVLEAETLIACRAASLEPSLGLLHADKDGRASFIFDLMEPLRPLVDRFILELLTKRSFKMNRDFLLLREGVCRLGIELAAEVGREICALVRPEATKVCASARASMLLIANVTYRVPRREMVIEASVSPIDETKEKISTHTPTTSKETGRVPQQAVLPLPSGDGEPVQPVTPDGRPPASPKGICCKCGALVGGKARYCDTHRSERFSQQWTAEWEKRKETGIDNAHGGEAQRKRAESIARSNAMKPRRASAK